MYAEFFGLTTLPFNNTPDPRFFYDTPDHEEALASLVYTATQRRGYALVTGEVGSGKTLLTRVALTRLPAGTQTAVVTNTRLSGHELLGAICREFQIPLTADTTPTEMCRALEEFLLEQYARDRLAVVIIDEAQNLSPDAFEELRLLGNLEAEDAKLLQVLILGQPELAETFRQASMRQLRQRLFRSLHLASLTADQTAGYIRHRLAVAGAKRDDIFSPEALTAVHTASGGMPRLVNQICDHALLAAFSRGVTTVTPEIVVECAESNEPLLGKPSALTAARVPAPASIGGSDLHGAVQRERPAPGTSSPGDWPVETAADGEQRVHAIETATARLTDRLDRFESRIATLADDLRSPREITEQVTTDLLTMRDLHDQAQAMFDQTRSTAELLTARAQHLGETGRSAIADLSGRANETLAGAVAQGRNVAAQVAMLREDLAAHLQHQTDGLRGLVTGATQTAAALSKPIGEQSDELGPATPEVLERLLSSTTGDLNAVREQLMQLRAGHAERTDRTLSALEKLVEHVTAQCRAATQQTSRMLVEAQTQSEQMSRQMDESRRQALAQTEAARARAAEMLAAATDLFTRTQQQMSEWTARLAAQAAEHMQRFEDASRAPTSAARQVVLDMESAIAATSARAAQARRDMDVLAGEIEHRLAAGESSLRSVFDEQAARLERLKQDADQAVTRLSAQLQDLRLAAVQQSQEQQRLIEEGRREALVHAAAVRSEASEVIQRLDAEITALRERARRESEELTAAVEARLQSATRSAEGAQKRIDASMEQVMSRAAAVNRQLDAASAEAQARLSGVQELARGAFDDLAGHADTVRAAWRGEVNALGERITGMIESARRESVGLVDEFRLVRDEVAAELEQTRARIAAERQSAREAVQRLAAGLAAVTRRAGETTGEFEQRLHRLLADAEQHAGRLSKLADELAARVSATIDDLQDRMGQAEAEHAGGVERARADLAALLDQQREQVDALDRRVRELAASSRGIGDELETRVAGLRHSAQRDGEAIAAGLGRVLDESRNRAAELRMQLETAQRELRATTDAAARQIDDAMARRQAISEKLRKLGSDATLELQTEIERAVEQGRTLRLEISTAGEEVRRVAETAEQQLRQTSLSATAQIEALRTAACRDAEQGATRLAALRQQVEGGLEELRQSASRLLQQAENSAGALRTHADELLSIANSGAERVSREAQALLAGAQAAAERFSAQAVELVQKAESQATAVRADIDRLRAETQAQHERWQETTSRTLRETQSLRDQADALLNRAGDVELRTRELMSMPSRVLAEADTKAGELRDITRNVAHVVRTLAAAQNAARQRAEQIEHANAAADERLSQISQHTARVGQLVGIIRQLHGALDARIDSLRERLEVADDICRNVPREIENLRGLLATESSRRRGRRPDSAAALESPVSAPVAAAAVVARSAPPTTPPASPPRRSRVTKAAVVPTKPASGGAQPAAETPSLGEVVRQNQKLNDWLKKTLAEAEAPRP